MMNDRLAWDKSYETGHYDLDEQHRWLFSTAQKIRNVDPDEADQVIEELFKYTEEHFKQEETLMESLDYPHMEEHLQQHEALIGRLNELTDSSKEKGETLEELISVLMDWLRKHILEQDVRFINYYSDRRTELLFEGLG